MKSIITKRICLALGVGLLSAPVQAKLVRCYGPGGIIATPADLGISGAASPFGGQCGVNEAQGVLLTEDLAVDGGVIPAGTRVNSHLIFQHLPGGVSSYARATWEFDGPVLGTMSDRYGMMEAGSSFLAAPGASYPGIFPRRGLETQAGDYVITGGNFAMMVSMVNWMGDFGDWVRVITVSVDADGDGVADNVDNVVNSDTRDTLFVAANDSGLSNDLILVTPDGTALEGVLLADIVDAILTDAKAASVAAYEAEHGDDEPDAKHRAENIYKEFLDLVEDELKVWEEADILLKEEREAIVDILKDAPLYRVASETGTVSVLGIDTGISNDLVLVAPDGSDLEGGVLLADIVSDILVDAQAAAEAKYDEEHGDHNHDAQHRADHVHDDFVDFANEALKVWEEAHIILQEERELIEDILKDAAP